MQDLYAALLIFGWAWYFGHCKKDKYLPKQQRTRRKIGRINKNQLN